VQKEPYTREQLQQVLSVARSLELQPYFIPGLREPQALSYLRTLGLEGFTASPSHDLRPVEDDRPYFYGVTTGVDRRLAYLLGGAGVAALLLAGAPALRHPQVLPLVFRLFAACLGAAYMLVEIYLLQRFSLLLGRPAFTLCVTLFGLLLSSAAGSLLGGRVRALGTGRGIGLAAVLTGAAGLALAWVQAAALPAALSLETGGRILAALALILPIGLLMGLCFPAGLRLAGQVAPGQIPWMWGINGVCSVLGSGLAVAVGMKWGTSWGLYSGAAAYLLAGAVMLSGGRGLGAPEGERAPLSWRKAGLFLGAVGVVWYGVFSSIAAAHEFTPPQERRAPPPVAPEVWPPGL